MPKSRHRKDQKRKAQNRTNRIKSEIKKFQKQQMEEQLKLLEEAKKQREANEQKQNESPEGQMYSISPDKA